MQKAATTPLTNHKKNPQPRFNRNQQYSITALTDGGGTIVERYAYTAYGQVTILDTSLSQLATSAVGNRHTYTGREWDEELSLYHYRARMCDAVSGRFVSRDPIGYVDGSDLYAFYNAIRTVDPLGLQSTTDLLIPDTQNCESFLGNLANVAGIPGVPADAQRRLNSSGTYLFCGDCRLAQNLAWGFPGADCNICLSNTTEAYPDQWVAILVHELTHCDQYRCIRGRGKPIVGPPKPIPNPPQPNCANCQRNERIAYRHQCRFLFPTSNAKQQACVQAGVCYSCLGACGGNPQFRRSCAQSAFPSYYPEPLPTVPPGVA